jgi:hypothetical protein
MSSQLSNAQNWNNTPERRTRNKQPKTAEPQDHLQEHPEQSQVEVTKKKKKKDKEKAEKEKEKRG